MNEINVIDLFAGPGGLGEGFAALRVRGRSASPFRLSLSVEAEAFAHRTLTLRSAYRGARKSGCVPAISRYWDYLRRPTPEGKARFFQACVAGGIDMDE